MRAALAAVLLLATLSEARAQVVPVDVRVIPVATPGGALGIRRIQLLFPNERPEITVKPGTPLTARAFVDYAGSGVLSGRWLVDGRPVQDFMQTLTFGSTLTLELGALPGLPTFEPGRHDVTVQISSPPVAWAPPVITYVVAASTGPGEGAITLLEPASGQRVAVPTARVGGVVFSWSQSGLPAPRYRIDIAQDQGGGVTGAPEVTALVDSKASSSYTLGSLQAETMKVGASYLWKVTALAASGAELAVSASSSFTLVADGAIQLLTPGSGESTPLPQRFTWSSSLATGVYELRAYTSAVALNVDLAALQGSTTRLAGPLAAVDPTPILVLPGSATGVDVPVAAALSPGLVVHWMVVAYQGRGRVFAAASAPSAFVVQPALQQVSGLPAILDLAGFQLAVRSYARDSVSTALSGAGAVRFDRDRTHADVPLDFRGLSATTYVERTRTSSGPGPGASVTITEVLKGSVTRGSIDQVLASPVTLDLQGYATEVSRMTLRAADPGAGAPAGAGEGAWASLRLTLPGYLRAPSGSVGLLDLPDTRLGPGGDFYREQPWASGALTLGVDPIGAVQLTRISALVADFTSQRDLMLASGQPYPADGLVLLVVDQASLPARVLFPVLEEASLRLSGVLPLALDGPRADLWVLESDPVHPVAPGGYEVTFTGGRVAIRAGSIDAGSLRLDGRARLPDALRRPSGGAAIVPFLGLAPAGDWLRAPVDAGDLEWTIGAAPPAPAAVGGKGAPAPTALAAAVASGVIALPDPLPFRVVAARGELAFPFGAPAVDPLAAGLRLAAGAVESPFAMDRTDPAGTVPADVIDLQVRAGGVSGSVASPPFAVPTGGLGRGAALTSFAYRRTLKLGDFGASLLAYQATLQDGAVLSSTVDGKLVIPQPVDLLIPFTGAHLTSTGEVMGPSLAMPTEVPLAWWHVGVTPASAVLSRSYLRLQGGTLRFAVDPRYGPEELMPLGLQHLDLGADGQIKAALTAVSTSFVGIPFAVGAEDAISFATWTNLPPTDSQPLVTLPGVLALPTIGGKTATFEQTATGAAVTFFDSSYERGNPDLIHVTGDLAWTNGFAKGKAYKEFLGLAKVDLLKAATLSGMVSIGVDGQGVYERYGLGISADAEKLVDLYQSGGVSVAAKLGAGVVSLATGGKGRATEVAKLAASLNDLLKGKFASQAVMNEKLFKALADAVKLAKAIHLDGGGKEGDEVATALDLGGAGLSIAAGLATQKKTLNYRELAVLVLTGLDAAFPILAKAKFAKDDPNALAVLGFIRLGVKALRFWAESPDGLTDKQRFALIGGIFQAARPLSSDVTYVLAMDVVSGAFTVAENASGLDELLIAQIAGGVLGTIRKANLVQGADWNNALALAQGLLDGAVAAKDLPSPDKWIFLATKLLETAGGSDMNYGARDDARVKQVARLAQRTLEVISAAGGGIPYEKAATVVKDAYDTASAAEAAAEFQATADPLNPASAQSPAPPRFGVHETVSRLIGVWIQVKDRPLQETLADVKQLLCDIAPDGKCLDQTTPVTRMDAALAAALAATTPEGLAAALGQVAGLGAWAKTAGAPTVDGATWRTMLHIEVGLQSAALKAKAADFAVRVLVPAVTGAQNPQDALRVVNVAVALEGLASSIDTGLGDVPIADLAWFDPVRRPVVEAAQGPLASRLGRDVLRRLAGASAPMDVKALWDEWRPWNDIVLASSSAIRDEVRAAFVKKEDELQNSCMVRSMASLAPHAVVQECLQAFSGLPGGAGAGAEIGALLSPIVTKAMGGIPIALFLQASYDPVSLPVGVGLLLSAKVFLPDNVDSVSVASSVAALQTSTVIPVDILASAVEGNSIDAEGVAYVAKKAREGEWSGGYAFTYLLGQALVASGKLDAAVVAPDLAAIKAHVQRGGAAVAMDLLRTMDIETGGIGFDAQMAVEYKAITDVLGLGTGAAEALVPGWIDKAKQAPCSKRVERRAWLRAVAPAVPGKLKEISDAQVEVSKGCTLATYDPAAELARAQAAGKEIQGELERLIASPAPDEDKKAMVAWYVAERLRTMTGGFYGEVPTEKVLRAVHNQVGFVIDHRQKSRIERLQGVAALLTAEAGDLFPQSQSVGKVVPAIVRGLGAFVEAGGQSMPPWQSALTLAASLANAAIPEDVPGARMAVGAWIGLLKTKGLPGQTAETVALTAIPIAVATGLAVGLGNKIRTGPDGQVDLAATFAAMGVTGEPWASFGVLAPEVKEILGAADEIQTLIGSLKVLTAGDATVKDRLGALRAFVDKAPKLGKVGNLASAFIEPVPHLKAPDTDQGEYTANLLLAELGEARGLLPGADAKPAESTCAAIAAPGATLATGTNDTLLCVIDLARRVVRGVLAQTIINPNPLDQVNAQAAAELAAIRQAAIFAPLAGDENLSGVSGGLEYRAGVFHTFELYGTFNLRNVLDAAVLLDYDDPQKRLTLRLASVDPRPADTLSRFGLVPGSNRILGTDLIANPLRLLEINVDGHTGCFDGKAVLGITSPFGGWETGEAALGLCWKPFTFALSATVNYGMFPPWKVVPTLSLCASETRGAALDLDVKAGIDVPNLFPEPVVLDAWGRGPYLKSWGVYGMLGLGLGFAAGPSGVEVRGRGSAEVGVSVTEKDEPNCLGVPLALGALFPGDTFEPRSTFQSRSGPVQYGICRSGFGVQAEFRAGAATLADFFLKSQSSVDLGLAKVGFWTYSGGGQSDKGDGSFPANRYGGWPSTSASPLSPGGLCGATP